MPKKAVKKVSPRETKEVSLRENEFHPAAAEALRWYTNVIHTRFNEFLMMREAMASTALSGNRLADLCNSTLNRLEKSEPVSDRYLLALCWVMRDILEKKTY